MTLPDEAPMCSTCGHFFAGDQESVGRAYAFLYDGTGAAFIVGREGFREDLEEVVLDMGNDEPSMAAAAVCYALTMGGWPEPEDLAGAVLHHATHSDGE